ncbi:MAG: RNA polymerase sigma factor [Planctomycetota bacterium]
MNRPHDPEPELAKLSAEPCDQQPVAHEREADCALALRRGEDTLGEWYRAAWPVVHRLCAGLLASTVEADDVAQDAMLHIADQLDHWDTSRPYAPWRQRIVVNRCRDHLRAGRRRRVHEEAAGAIWHGASLPDPASLAASAEVGALVDRCLVRLPPREREVFVLVDLEGTPPVEVALLLGITSSTVRAALALARRRLRAALAPHLAEGDCA